MSINLLKTAVGGVIGAGLSTLVDTNENPYAIPLIAGALIVGQAVAWLPSLVNRCLTKAPVQQQQARQDVVEILDPHHEEHDPHLQQAIRASRLDALPYERRVQLAMERSLEQEDRKMDYKSDDTDLDLALRLSRRPQQVKVCALKRAYNAKEELDPIEEEEIIPEGFEFATEGGTFYHAGNLVLGLLSRQDKNRDPFGKKITDEDLRLLANMMGISDDLFINIWFLAETDQDSEHHIPEERAGLKTDYRYNILKGLLEESPSSLSRDFLKFFKASGIPAFQ